MCPFFIMAVRTGDTVHIILGTEIWGRTAHVDAMAESLKEIAAAVTVVDPYDGTDQNFASEEEAYASFQNAGGYESLEKKIAAAMEETEDTAYLLGFSAGAGAIWSALNNTENANAKAAWCFYSSAIYKMMEHTPSIPVEMIFPDSEKNFDVEAIARDLQDKPNVQCYITPFAHGFLNPAYDHFDQEVYNFWIDWIKDQITIASQA